MSEEENPTGIVEHIRRSYDKTSEIHQAADEGWKGSASSKTVEETSLDKDKTVENTDKESQQNFRKQPQNHQSWLSEHRKSLDSPPRTSGTAKEPQKNFIKLSEVFESVEKSCKKLPKTSTPAKDDQGSQKRINFGVIQDFPASVEKQNNGPSTSGVITCDSSLPLPSDRPRSKTTLQERPATRPIAPSQRRTYPLSNIQNQVTTMMQGFMSFLPREYRSELWIYAAGYVFLYSLLMLFTTSTFGFICMMIYVALVALLVLRFFELGPLARRTPR